MAAVDGEWVAFTRDEAGAIYRAALERFRNSRRNGQRQTPADPSMTHRDREVLGAFGEAAYQTWRGSAFNVAVKRPDPGYDATEGSARIAVKTNHRPGTNLIESTLATSDAEFWFLVEPHYLYRGLGGKIPLRWHMVGWAPASVWLQHRERRRGQPDYWLLGRTYLGAPRDFARALQLHAEPAEQAVLL